MLYVFGKSVSLSFTLNIWQRVCTTSDIKATLGASFSSVASARGA